jgi:hypothetical protein
MDEIEVFLRLALMGLALILVGLTVASWYKTRELKLLLAAAGFGIFALEGVLLALGIFMTSAEEFVSLAVLVGLNLLTLIFIYLSFLKR